MCSVPTHGRQGGTPASTTHSWRRSSTVTAPLVVVAGAGTWQDAYPHRPGRPPARARGAPGAHPAAHLHPAGGRRHAGRALPPSAGTARSARRLRGGTFHAVAHQLCRRLRGAARAAAGVLGARPGGRRRRDGPAAGRARAGRYRGPHAPRPATLVDIYSRCVNTPTTGRPRSSTTTSRGATPTRERSATCSAPTSPASASTGSWTSTTCCSTGAPRSRADGIGPQMAGMFDHVLVDEYQDVNACRSTSCAPCAPTAVG